MVRAIVSEMIFSITVRTFCLSTLCLCLLLLMIQSYINLYRVYICNKFETRYNQDITEYSLTESKAWNHNWDLRYSNKSVKVRDRNFILVRHGHYHDTSGKLSEKGKRQSNETGKRIKIMNHPYAKIISSTMQRALETAEIIKSFIPGVSLEKDDLLEEGGPTPPNPKVSFWNLPDKNYFVDGPRIESAFRKYFYRADYQAVSTSYEIIVAHGNIIRYFILRALQFQADGWMRIFIGHASITYLTLKGDGTVAILLFGDVGHLRQEDITY